MVERQLATEEETPGKSITRSETGEGVFCKELLRERERERERGTWGTFS